MERQKRSKATVEFSTLQKVSEQPPPPSPRGEWDDLFQLHKIWKQEKKGIREREKEESNLSNRVDQEEEAAWSNQDNSNKVSREGESSAAIYEWNEQGRVDITFIKAEFFREGTPCIWAFSQSQSPDALVFLSLHDKALTTLCPH